MVFSFCINYATIGKPKSMEESSGRWVKFNSLSPFENKALNNMGNSTEIFQKFISVGSFLTAVAKIERNSTAFHSHGSVSRSESCKDDVWWSTANPYREPRGVTEWKETEGKNANKKGTKKKCNFLRKGGAKGPVQSDKKVYYGWTNWLSADMKAHVPSFTKYLALLCST